MADVNRGKRPLSPFMIGQYYRPQINSITSIVNRITGVAMSLAAILIVWWFLALAIGPEYFDSVNWLLTSWVGLLVLVGSLWAFWFHLFNGIRHLRWDMGVGLGIGESDRTGKLVIALSVIATVITVVLVLM